MLSSRPPSEWRHEGAEEAAEAAEAAEARALLESAVELAVAAEDTQQAANPDPDPNPNPYSNLGPNPNPNPNPYPNPNPEQAVRALLASATLCEARGETQAAGDIGEM